MVCTAERQWGDMSGWGLQHALEEKAHIQVCVGET